MPHPDNRNWMSLLLGEMPEAPKRTEVADLVASRGVWDLSHLNQNLPAGVARETVTLRERDGAPLTGELYTPEGPIAGNLIYLHGGGWCAGEAANERQIAMRFAARGFLVLNLDYALAPERPFPAGLNDCIYASRWLVANAPAHGGPAGSLSIGGQSAGANLSAATVAALTGPYADRVPEDDLAATDLRFDAILLLSGIFSFPLLLSEPGSNVGPAELWHQAYLGPNFLARNRDPLASPMFADLSGFPPAYVACGDEDSLLGQSLGMVKALTTHNVPTTMSVLAGFDHGYQFLEDRFAGPGAEMSRARDWLEERVRSDEREESNT